MGLSVGCDRGDGGNTDPVTLSPLTHFTDLRSVTTFFARAE